MYPVQVFIPESLFLLGLHVPITPWTGPKKSTSWESLNLASRDSECLGSRTSHVEADFHSIRNSGVWNFGWDLGTSLSARTGRAIVSPACSRRSGYSYRSAIRRFFGAAHRNSQCAPLKETQAARTNIIRCE